MIKPKFEIDEEVVLNQSHINYLGTFPAGKIYKVKKIEVTYVIEDEDGNPLGHIDEYELDKIEKTN